MRFKRQYGEIIAFCRSHGIKVSAYEASSTNSIYLKLDDGVLNTIRISDHNGKKKLKYRYNLIKDAPTGMVVDGGFTRYYFNMRDLHMMLDRILEDRMYKIERYGYDRYVESMQNNVEDNKDKYGFWSMAEIVQNNFFMNYQAVDHDYLIKVRY